ncbi:PTS system regulatory protein, PhoU domain-containing protein [[Mycoplasma] cavipharyngis]|uniref:PhoU domain-containing protein n=1 Tax=[Mycoplasma] cavipharyngis TaxID=92757 RepID=UPI00370412B0
MAINYRSLDRTIRQSYVEFLKYFNLALKQNKIVSKYFKSNQHNAELYEKIRAIEKKSNLLYGQIYELIAWNISKEQPVNNHLNFFLSLLNSLKDIERICDINYNICKITKNITKWNKIFHHVFQLHEESDVCLEKMHQLFSQNPHHTSTVCFRSCQKLQKSFHEKYAKTLAVIANDYFESIVSHLLQNQDKEKLVPKQNFGVQLSLISKQIERKIDHCLNIIENFYWINHRNDENKILDRETTNK